MTQVAGTTDSFDLIGTAEDVSDVIYDISPEETPFQAMAQRMSVHATNYEWQTDSLAAAAANRQVEGDDASFTTATPTTMLSNRTQIARKTVIVSETADVIKKYGRAKELARLVTKYGREFKRDVEFALTQNQASSAGGSQTARSSAGLESMIAGNRILVTTGNTTGTTPGYSSGDWTAPTDGTATATLTEASLIAGIQAAWEDGGDPSVLMMGFKQKQYMAAFTGATKYAGVTSNVGGRPGAQAAIIGGVDLYISDVGEHKVRLNRFQRTRTVFGLDPEYWAVGWLRPPKLVDLAKTGDANKKMIIGEFTLIGKQPDSSFKIQDLPTS